VGNWVWRKLGPNFLLLIPDFLWPLFGKESMRSVKLFNYPITNYPFTKFFMDLKNLPPVGFNCRRAFFFGVRKE
jgi:hypothetical protein